MYKTQERRSSREESPSRTGRTLIQPIRLRNAIARRSCGWQIIQGTRKAVVRNWFTECQQKFTPTASYGCCGTTIGRLGITLQSKHNSSVLFVCKDNTNNLNFQTFNQKFLVQSITLDIKQDFWAIMNNFSNKIQAESSSSQRTQKSRKRKTSGSLFEKMAASYSIRQLCVLVSRS